MVNILDKLWLKENSISMYVYMRLDDSKIKHILSKAFVFSPLTKLTVKLINFKHLLGQALQIWITEDFSVQTRFRIGVYLSYRMTTRPKIQDKRKYSIKTLGLEYSKLQKGFSVDNLGTNACSLFVISDNNLKN